MEIGGGFEVPAANHVGDSLRGVVEHHGEVVARRHVLAGEDRVAPAGRIRKPDRVGLARREGGVGVRPGAECQRPRTVEAPGMRLLRDRPAPACAGIERRPVRIAGLARRRLDLPPGTGAGIDEAPRPKIVEGGAVGGHPGRLAPDRVREAEAEPGEVVDQAVRQFRPAAERVDVLDAQQQITVQRPGELRVEEGRIGVAEMQAPVRARGEAQAGRRHGGMRTKTDPHAISPPEAGVTGPLLDSEAALREGTAALAARDPVMARLVAQGAQPVLRKRAPGFEGLAGIVVGQQISTAAASAIWGRLTAGLPDLTAETLTEAPDEMLRGAGLSAPKIRTLRAAAEAVIGGALPLDTLHARSADEAHRLMVAVHGIGPWTADVYLLFCLGHPDAFPAGDLALQEAARLADGLETRPNPAALIARAEAWRPWRGSPPRCCGPITGWRKRATARPFPRRSRDGAPLPS